MPEIPKTTQPIAPAVGQLPEHDAKTLFQETPTLFLAHGEKKLVMTRKYSPARFQGAIFFFF